MRFRNLLLLAATAAFASLTLSAAPLKILVTNDDGYTAPGIRALRQALTNAGYDVTVVAPRTDQSGKGTSIFASSIGKLNVQYDTTERAYSVAGSPVDCVQAALQVILTERPDIVVSGVNLGENLGTVAISSGTVSAAVVAAQQGVPAIAVSAGLKLTEAGLNPPFPSTFKAQVSASTLVAQIIAQLDAKRAEGQPLLPHGVALNINYPPLDNPGSPLVTSLSRSYNTLSLGLKPDADYATSGNLVLSFAPAAKPQYPDRFNDAEMLSAGYITITPLTWDWTAPVPSIQEARKLLNGIIE
jgi:5'/3'-nucleotidase SurE